MRTANRVKITMLKSEAKETNLEQIDKFIWRNGKCVCSGFDAETDNYWWVIEGEAIPYLWSEGTEPFKTSWITLIGGVYAE